MSLNHNEVGLLCDYGMSWPNSLVVHPSLAINLLRKKKLVHGFTFQAFGSCLSCMSFYHNAVGLFAVCDYDISWSYSLAFMLGPCFMVWLSVSFLV